MILQSFWGVILFKQDELIDAHVASADSGKYHHRNRRGNGATLDHPMVLIDAGCVQGLLKREPPPARACLRFWHLVVGSGRDSRLKGEDSRKRGLSWGNGKGAGINPPLC